MPYIQRRKTKDGKARYRVQVRLKGHPVESATFERKTDAKDWAQQTEAAIKEGRYFTKAEARKHTLAELVERYIGNVLPAYKPKERQKRAMQLEWWKGQLGAYTLADVKAALIAEKRDELAKGRSPATVNRYLAALSHACSVAVKEWAWLESNPVRKVSRRPEPRGRVRCLSDEERASLLEACKKSADKRLYPLVVLALSTAARQGELLGLRWKQDVDLQRGVAVFDETKNEERRAVPIAGHALELLREMSKTPNISGYVFAGAAGKPTFPRNAWYSALSAAQVDDFRWHDLRHCAATYLAQDGATLAELAAVLGHRTLAMVKRYQHLTEVHTSGVVTRMNERIFGGGA